MIMAVYGGYGIFDGIGGDGDGDDNSTGGDEVMVYMVVVTKNVNWALEKVSGSLHFPGEPPALCQPVEQILNKIN